MCKPQRGRLHAESTNQENNVVKGMLSRMVFDPRSIGSKRKKSFFCNIFTNKWINVYAKNISNCLSNFVQPVVKGLVKNLDSNGGKGIRFDQNVEGCHCPTNL